MLPTTAKASLAVKPVSKVDALKENAKTSSLYFRFERKARLHGGLFYAVLGFKEETI